MEQERFKEILEIGETIRVEFKRCGNGIESDTYETVCSFLNRFGGDIFLGVTDPAVLSAYLKIQYLLSLRILSVVSATRI